jgi:hypothetical protein
VTKNKVTCAKHGWDGVEDKKVYHAGQYTGTITASLGEDIGLFNPAVPFSNRFFNINITAKTLLHSSLIPFGQFVVIGSAYTSKQRMRLFGLRVSEKTRPSAGYIGSRQENEYVQPVDQSIFSGRADVKVNREPHIRDGVCGTPILHQGFRRRLGVCCLRVLVIWLRCRPWRWCQRYLTRRVLGWR